MQFPRYLIAKLLPISPPERFIGGVAKQIAESIEDPLLRRSYLWSIAVTNAGLDSRLAAIPRLINYSAGFVYISKENTLRHRWVQTIEGFSYGASILIESEESLPQVVLSLEIGSTVFPVVVDFGLIEEHGLPTHPHTGTGTCWIENQNPSGQWQKGILTCRHTVASIPLRSTVTLHRSVDHSRPNTGVLVDRTICTIDAAVIEVNGLEWPNGLSQLPICNPVIPGQAVSFKGRNSNGTGSILTAYQDPNYFGNLFGQRISTDCFGLRGDSGSLFYDQNDGKGLGIYIGTVPDGSGGRKGLCQHLSQASLFFGFSTFL